MGEPIFDLTNHRALWTWLSENPDKDKDNWPEWAFNGGEITRVQEADCFCCKYMNEKTLHSFPRNCNFCPLIWPENLAGDKVCDDAEGLWAEWDSLGYEIGEVSLKLRSELAKEIANLPVKDGIKTK